MYRFNPIIDYCEIVNEWNDWLCSHTIFWYAYIVHEYYTFICSRYNISMWILNIHILNDSFTGFLMFLHAHKLTPSRKTATFRYNLEYKTHLKVSKKYEIDTYVIKNSLSSITGKHRGRRMGSKASKCPSERTLTSRWGIINVLEGWGFLIGGFIMRHLVLVSKINNSDPRSPVLYFASAMP